jgi:hypothetical protein
MAAPMVNGIYRFTCLRPDHTDVYDQHVLATDYDALGAALENANGLRSALENSVTKLYSQLERAREWMRHSDSCSAPHCTCGLTAFLEEVKCDPLKS